MATPNICSNMFKHICIVNEPQYVRPHVIPFFVRKRRAFRSTCSICHSVDEFQRKNISKNDNKKRGKNVRQQEVNVLFLIYYCAFPKVK